MTSIFRDYEYDIFISYRHNDNAYDGWITEFVANLQKELVATVKDKLSVFFDDNLKDGLKDSDNVDHTISSKIKALILIPIVSQTYCDTNSFAWNNEFLHFNKSASEDRFGREIRLSNGNFASRILPVKIHEIEGEDIRMLEGVLQGSLRSIDFIYQAQGVNRPLLPKDDDRLDNMNNTIYRNQINKVANAIKEIVHGLKVYEARSHNMEIPEKNLIPSGKINSMPAWYSTRVPADIRLSILDDQQQAVYLAWTSSDLKAKREEIAMVLTRAGFKVIPK